MGLSVGGRTGSWGVERDREVVIDGQDESDIFPRGFDLGWVCGRQCFGSDNATDNLKTGRAIFPSMDGKV